MSGHVISHIATHTISGTFTRPADTNAYTIGDVICNSTSAPVVITFTGISKASAGVGMIQDALCITSANQTTKPDIDLYLFDTAPTIDNDNAAFTPTDAELLTLIGVVNFGASDFKAGDITSGAGGNAFCHVRNLAMPFKSVGATTNAIYGVVQARNAYTPVSGEIFTFRLKVLD